MVTHLLVLTLNIVPIVTFSCFQRFWLILLKLKPPPAVMNRPAVITCNSSCRPPRLAQPEQTGFPLTQLALGLIIIWRRCVYFCRFHIPNYFCYSNIILALMPQILYLNSVRFPFSVPSEDCSCKIHGLRVGITQASRGWTYQVHTPSTSPLLFFFLLPLVLSP